MKAATFWIFIALVVLLSIVPVDYLPPPAFSIWDKAQHAAAFAVLTLLGLRAYDDHAPRVVAGLVLLGGFIEVAQAATGWRHGEWLDLLADVVGIATAIALLTAIHRLRTHRLSTTD